MAAEFPEGLQVLSSEIGYYLKMHGPSHRASKEVHIQFSLFAHVSHIQGTRKVHMGNFKGLCLFYSILNKGRRVWHLVWLFFSLPADHEVSKEFPYQLPCTGNPVALSDGRQC